MSDYIYGTRVTYVASGVPNVLVTREVYMKETSEGIKHYRGYLDPAKGKWILRDEKTSDLIAEGTGTSLHKMKLKLKNQLAKLGVKFEDEKRKPRKEIED